MREREKGWYPKKKFFSPSNLVLCSCVKKRKKKKNGSSSSYNNNKCFKILEKSLHHLVFALGWHASRQEVQEISEGQIVVIVLLVVVVVVAAAVTRIGCLPFSWNDKFFRKMLFVDLLVGGMPFLVNLTEPAFLLSHYRPHYHAICYTVFFPPSWRRDSKEKWDEGLYRMDEGWSNHIDLETQDNHWNAILKASVDRPKFVLNISSSSVLVNHHDHTNILKSKHLYCV